MHDATQQRRLNVTVRRFDHRDLDQVRAIFNASPHPWDDTELISAVNEPWVVGLVAVCTNQVVGAAIFQIERNHITIDELVVASAYRRRGVGSALLAPIKRRVIDQRRAYVSLDLWERNCEGQDFLRAAGFRATSVMRNYYDHDGPRNGDAAYRFEWRPPA